MKKVYLAGKIAPYESDWRKDWIGDNVGSYLPSGELCSGDGQSDDLITWPLRNSRNGLFHITGPFFIEGEGHDGQHGRGTHGMGLLAEYVGGWPTKQDKYGQAATSRRRRTKRLCMEAIRDADTVVAYLRADDTSAIGTYWELGFAAGMGKKIVIYIDAASANATASMLDANDPYDAPENLLLDGWFVFTGQKVWPARNPLDAFNHFAGSIEPEFASPAERSFYQAFKRASDAPIIVCQHQIGRYYVDFALPEHRLTIEIDGLQHHSGQDKFIADQRRQRFIQKQGWTVLRFAAKEALDDPTTCVRAVLDFIA